MEIHAARAVRISEIPAESEFEHEEFQEQTTYAGWRKHRSHRTPGAFELYCKDVATSFARDWRQFFTSLSPQMVTPAIMPSTDSLRGVIEPVRDWLVKPIPTRHPRVMPRSKERKSSNKKS
jgi:hypothetical protein